MSPGLGSGEDVHAGIKGVLQWWFWCWTSSSSSIILIIIPPPHTSSSSTTRTKPTTINGVRGERSVMEAGNTSSCRGRAEHRSVFSSTS